MKTGTKIILTVIALAAMGCAKDKKGNGGDTTSPSPYPGYYIPTGSGPGLNPGIDWTYGASADLEVTNSALDYYNGVNLPVNTPTNVRVNLNLQQFDPVGNSTRHSYGGVVTIAYDDYGRHYEDHFTSLINENHWYGEGMVDTNEKNNKYNVWITINNKKYWHGFFQDGYGAVIIVIDDNDDLGDGQGPTKVSGEIWVKNFGLSYAPVSPTSCWFVSLGPYDCRSWKSGDGVNTDKAIYPTDGYKKLGDFYDMDFQDAFNGASFGN